MSMTKRQAEEIQLHAWVVYDGQRWQITAITDYPHKDIFFTLTKEDDSRSGVSYRLCSLDEATP